MHIITERQIIQEVRERWLTQYASYRDTDRLWDKARTVGESRAAVNTLDLDKCTRADVDRAIGNTSWAANECDECKQHRPVLVHFGDDPGYDARWQDVCLDCLSKAADLLKSV